MPSNIYQIAHIKEQGQQIIIIPVSNSVGRMTNTEQNKLRNQLQHHAEEANLAGTVCLVWECSRKRFNFLAPQPYHPFFKSLNMRMVACSINKKLTIR